MTVWLKLFEGKPLLRNKNGRGGEASEVGGTVGAVLATSVVLIRLSVLLCY